MCHAPRAPLAALIAAVLPAIVSASAAPQPAAARQREAPDQLRAQQAASRAGVVVTGSAAASWAGTRLLEAGGNAVDAAVAAAFALGAAEPGSSGIGGQTYILIRMADGRAVAVDGSARAPLRASAEVLQRHREETNLVRPGTYLPGYPATATPGSLAALDLALRVYGTRSLAEVVEPAVAIAEFGSPLTPSLRSFLDHYAGRVQASPYLSRLFLKDPIDLWDPDHVYCNPDLACFLRRLAAVGIQDFYRGSIAAEIEADMAANGGWLQIADLSLLEATVREPVRGRYRGLEVLSFPHPGGGAAVVEALGILDRLDPALLRGDSADSLHLVVEACRLALADTFPSRRPPRPPDEIAVDPAHLTRRAALIRLDRALGRSEVSSEPLSTLDVGGTVQVSVADSSGNVVALTQTLGASFGSGAATEGFGFAYNNLLHGFEFKDRRAWSYLAPLRAPMTSMAPTILLRDGVPLFVLGSSGSSRIGPAIVSAIVNVVDRGLDPCEAVSAPRALWGGNSDEQVYLEAVDPITEVTAELLARRGFRQQKRLAYPAAAYDVTDFGGVNAVFIDPVDGTMVGVADARRQGVARAVDPTAGVPPPLALPACWRDLYALPAAAPRRR